MHDPWKDKDVPFLSVCSGGYENASPGERGHWVEDVFDLVNKVMASQARHYLFPIGNGAVCCWDSITDHCSQTKIIDAWGGLRGWETEEKGMGRGAQAEA